MSESQHTVRPRRRTTNVLTRAIEDFITTLSDKVEPHTTGDDEEDPDLYGSSSKETSTDQLPKRYTIYEPMLLLPGNFIIHSPAWQKLYRGLTASEREQLFKTIATMFQAAGQNVTRIALNAPIRLSSSDEGIGEGQNMKRSPIDLQPLYGDFGPDQLLADSSYPCQPDFDKAFWVTTTQVGSVKQVWAPRWTMFSRGNIREKGRILQDKKHNDAPFLGLTEKDLGQPLSEIDVVDMYIGIGYFAIPYLKRGVRRVFGWDINGWSIEGLRRGCELNEFSREVVDATQCDTASDIKRIAEHVARLLRDNPSLQCIAFLGDNKSAAQILRRIKDLVDDATHAPNIRHCNLGLLPTSFESWTCAVECLSPRGGWLHVHENAELDRVVAKVLDVEASLNSTVSQRRGPGWKAQVGYTEMVKTYAPGIGHFVFDINMWPAEMVND